VLVPRLTCGRLQELNCDLQLKLGNVALQIQENDYSILSIAKKQLSAFLSARSLYVTAKNHAVVGLHQTELSVKIIYSH